MSVIYDVIGHVRLYGTRHSHVDVTCAGQREGSLSEGFQRAFKVTGASHVISCVGHVY